MTFLSAITFDISRVDGNAVTIFLIGFGVVFFALLIIYLIFAAIPHLLKINLKKNPDHNSKPDSNVATKVQNNENEEVFVAIAMALSLHFEDTHDEESLVLTLSLNDNLNTSWNSKIQNISLHN